MHSSSKEKKLQLWLVSRRFLSNSFKIFLCLKKIPMVQTYSRHAFRTTWFLEVILIAFSFV